MSHPTTTLANQLFQGLSEIRLLPALILDDASLAGDIAEALKAGNLPCIEVTLRTPNALKVIHALSADSSLWLGAGTVLNVEQAKAALDAGARYLVAPGLNAKVAEYALSQGVPLIPGAVTATEIMLALEYSCPIVKFFPSESMGGVKAMQALSGPLPQTRFVPTGGVHAQNLAAFLNMTKVVAVGGSWMVAPALIEARNFGEITRLAAEARTIAQAAPKPEPLV